MNLSLNQIIPLLIHEFESEGDLLKSIRQVQENFTSNRSNLEEYWDSKKLIAAYSSYYFPTNVSKANFIINIVKNEKRELLTNFKNLEFIDFGAGPGTYSFAFSNEHLFKSYNIVDHSPYMIEQAKAFSELYTKNTKLEYWNEIPKHLKNQVLFFGHSLNEMNLQNFNHLIESLDPEYIMLLEPGTKHGFQNIIDVKNALEKEYSCLYPCDPQVKGCPLAETENWCHFKAYAIHDQSIERLSQLLKIDRRVMPLVFHIYRKKMRMNNESSHVRILRLLRETKFSLDFEICMGRDVRTFICLKKFYSKKEIKQIKYLSGNKVKVEMSSKSSDAELKGKIIIEK